MSKPLMLPIDQMEGLKAVIKAAVRDVLNEMLQEKRSELSAFIREALEESEKNTR
jgi:hypothetical protein